MRGFLDSSSPRWFTIAAHRPFLTDLANRLWRDLSPIDPMVLSQAMVLLPNRRAARALAQAFVAGAEGRAVLAPQMRALGDLDEGEAPFEPGDLATDLPPAIGAARRRFELAGLVVAHADLLDRQVDASGAIDLADALARFLDGLQIEERDADIDLAGLVEGDLARHWRRTADFLDIALKAWPRRLAELGVMDIAKRRVVLMRRLEARWRDHPPADVIIAAGSTGSTPAAAGLLAAIAGAPRGCVVLPGLDLGLEEKAWGQVGEQHPQGSLKRLLGQAGVARADVRPWDTAAESEAAGRWRRRVVNEALRPPDATADWLEVIKRLSEEAPGLDPVAEGLRGLTVIRARAEEEAAAAAALLLREAMETLGRTVALITPDVALARRVRARMARWGVSPDSSVGEALAGAPCGRLASLVAGFAVDPDDPVALLAIAKHPLTRLGLATDEREAARGELELHGLRGPRPDGWDELDRRLTDADAGAAAGADLARRLKGALGLAAEPFAAGSASVADAARANARALEALAEGPGADGEPWTGQAGAALAEIVASMIADSAALPPTSPAAFADLLNGLMGRTPLRPGGATHPRLAILGVLEARLVRSDLTILAGLEEGVWPAAAPVDPFLSRPMRRAIGLPPPERRIGLSAHDFAQAACAGEVVLLLTERRDGAPSVPSRWLWRLEALAKGAGLDLPGRPDILALARTLDAPLADPPAALRPATRPEPKPPTALRPRKLSVTTIERWLRDPYSIYAQYVLGLTALNRPDEEVDAKLRGTAVHSAFERFGRIDLPADAEQVFAAYLLAALRAAGMSRARMAREEALALNAARWVAEFERRRRPGALLLVEQRGSTRFITAGGEFTLSARADRIEVRGAIADIIDFKTGAPPSKKQVKTGISPQLTLTAAILARGGFAGAEGLTPGELLYVRVGGGRIPGQVEARDEGEAPAMAQEAFDRLKLRVEFYDDPAQGYASWAMPQFIARYGGDYDHLARLWEWYVLGEEGDEA